MVAVLFYGFVSVFNRIQPPVYVLFLAATGNDDVLTLTSR